MRILRRLGDDRRHVEELARGLVVEMELRRSHRFERLQKGHVGARTAGVIERPGAAEPFQPLHHAPDRRDADAAGEQHDVLGALHQREIVARRADLERLADAQLVVHVTRAAAAGRIALDADGVGCGIGLGVDQRILPDQPVRQMQVDMRARLIGRQRLPVRSRELVEMSVAGGVANRGHAHLDQAVGRLCRRGLHGCGRHVIHQHVSCGGGTVIGHRSRFVNYRA